MAARSSIRRWLCEKLEWCRAHPYWDSAVRWTPTGALVALAFVWVLAVVVTFLFQQRSTTTVTAVTETIRLELIDGRTLSWNLPAGSYSLLEDVAHEDCSTRSFGSFTESVCQVSGNSRLTVEGYADVTLQITPEGALLVSLATKEGCDSVDEGTRAGCDFQASIVTRNGPIELQNYRLIQYQATPNHRTLRLPLVGESAVLGSDIHGASTTDGTAYDHWQPVLDSGDVRIIATNIPGDERYIVLDERLDRGDVVQVGRPMRPPWVWGMVDVSDIGSLHGFAPQNFYRLTAVLHTSLPEIHVTRFGSPEGHLINVSKWTVLSKWPNGQQGWVVVVSVSILVTFILQLGDTFRQIRPGGDTPGDNTEKQSGSASGGISPPDPPQEQEGQ